MESASEGERRSTRKRVGEKEKAREREGPVSYPALGRREERRARASVAGPVGELCRVSRLKVGQ